MRNRFGKPNSAPWGRRCPQGDQLFGGAAIALAGAAPPLWAAGGRGIPEALPLVRPTKSGPAVTGRAAAKGNAPMFGIIAGSYGLLGYAFPTYEVVMEPLAGALLSDPHVRAALRDGPLEVRVVADVATGKARLSLPDGSELRTTRETSASPARSSGAIGSRPSAPASGRPGSRCRRWDSARTRPWPRSPRRQSTCGRPATRPRRRSSWPKARRRGPRPAE